MQPDANATPPEECGPDTLTYSDDGLYWSCSGPCGNTNLHPVKAA